jgi:hypothetical protein
MSPNEIQKRKNILQKLAITYRWHDKPMPKEDKLVFKTVNGIDFYMVGHNASHEFYLGLDEAGNYWARSFGEDAYYDENDVDSEPTYSEYIYKIDNLENAYLGHL